MLELKNIFFDVPDPKGTKVINKGLNLTIEQGNYQVITGKSIAERANLGISFAFQQPVRFKGIHVLDLLRLAAGRTLSAADACEYLSQVGLCAKDYINREINGSLSGGELK